jgi:hypothetical protein
MGNQPLLWTGPRPVVTLFVFKCSSARRLARDRASSVMPPTAVHMGMWGYLHRVSAEKLSALLADETLIFETLYPAEGVEPLPECTVEKTWNAIEFILDRLAESEQIPWVGPLTGGTATKTQLDYGAVPYLTSVEVKQLAAILSGISKENFKRGYMPKTMAKVNVYPQIWDRPEEDENFEYVSNWYSGMVKFYSTAAEHGDCMLLHLG